MVGTAIGAAVSVGTSMIGASSASDAADAQVASNDRASQIQMDMFNKMQKNLQPYMASGGAANNALLDLMGLNNYAGSIPGAGGAGAGLSTLNPTDLIDTSQNVWKPNADLYASDPTYKKAWDDFITWHKGKYHGQVPNTAAGSDLTTGANQLIGQFGFNLGNYNKTIEDKKAALSQSAGGGPVAGPLDSALLKAPSMNFNQAMLEQTPGYQFNLKQGLKAVQNSAAARGLGVSGAAEKGAADYATGLADSTYQNQFNNAVTNQTNQFNRLMALTNLGQNSAAGVGQAGISTGNSLASNAIGSGNAQAAGSIAAGQAYQGTGNNILLNNLTGGGLFGGNSNSLMQTQNAVNASVNNPANSSFF